jgi:hypothetical protein
MKFRALLALLLSPVFAWIDVRAGTVISRPFLGVTCLDRRETSPRPVTMHIAVIDLRAPGVRFRLTSPRGTRDTMRQTTLDFLHEAQAQLAINCHFMVPFPTSDNDVNVVGLAAMQGKIYSPFEPQPIAPEFVDQSYAILPFAPALTIRRGNHVRLVPGDPADPSMGKRSVRRKIHVAVSGSAQIVTDGVKTIPTYSGAPRGLNPLNGYSDFNSWYERIRARTAIGVTKDGHSLVLFTVDEVGGSAGMTVGEVAEVLIRDYHVEQALNLDGGGSTTMALEDPVTGMGRIFNTPSDNPLGRAVGSNLAVFARRRPTPVISFSTDKTNHLVVSWPAPSTRWRLLWCTQLNSTNWVPVSAPARRVGHRMEVILPASGPCGFYRLEPRN